MRLRTSPEADRDTYDIHIYGSLRYGVQQADSYLDGLQHTLELIAEMPLMARERHEVRPAVRVYPYGAHHIFYVVADGEVLVVRILHYTADWMILL
ncbi:MAG: type II toxin-antitoxin system RelE/ParE family toxin [Devosia sp.]